jgi:hypothetical protein
MSASMNAITTAAIILGMANVLFFGPLFLSNGSGWDAQWTEKLGAHRRDTSADTAVPRPTRSFLDSLVYYTMKTPPSGVGGVRDLQRFPFIGNRTQLVTDVLLFGKNAMAMAVGIVPVPRRAMCPPQHRTKWFNVRCLLAICFPSEVSCHSRYPEAGIRQRVRTASKKKGFVSIVSAPALNAAIITSLMVLLRACSEATPRTEDALANPHTCLV